MYADFHLIPLNAATSCHQWCPSYPSLQSLVHPVQSSAGVVTEQLLASGRGWVLPVFNLPYAHARHQMEPVSPGVEFWVGAVFCCGLLSAALSTLHLSQLLLICLLFIFQNLVAFLICSLFQLLFPWDLFCSVTASLRGTIS